MKCIILGAGYATRLYPLTKNYPKPLLEVNGKTIIDWLIDDLEINNNIDKYIIVSNHKFINNYNKWLENNKLKDKILLIDDGTNCNEERLGAVVDIKLAIDKLNINDNILIIAGDNLLDFSLNEFIKYFENKKYSCVMRYYENNLDKVKKSAELIIDKNDLVIEMNEKPNNPKSHYCCPPFYIYKKEDIKLIDEALENGCKKDAPGSLVEFLSKQIKIYAMDMPGKRYDIGTLDSYEEICKTYKK